MKADNYEDFFIFVSDATPSYIKESQLKSVQINMLKEDNFEMIWQSIM